MSESWIYPPAQAKPDKTKPARLIYDETAKQLLLEFYDVQSRLYRIPVVGVILPPEFQELRAALGLTDLFPIVKLEHVTAVGNVKISHEEAKIKVPADIQDHWQSNIVIAGSAARTASGNSPDIDVGAFIMGVVCIDVTAVSGTSPTLDVYIEGRDQLTGKYRVIASQTGITTTGTWWLDLPNIPFRFIRARWVIGGTSPSFTFSISMEAKA